MLTDQLKGHTYITAMSAKMDETHVKHVRDNNLIYCIFHSVCYVLLYVYKFKTTYGLSSGSSIVVREERNATV